MPTSGDYEGVGHPRDAEDEYPENSPNADHPAVQPRSFTVSPVGGSVREKADDDHEPQPYVPGRQGVGLTEYQRD